MKKKQKDQRTFSSPDSIGPHEVDWLTISFVIFVICVMVFAVLNHAKDKPDTPQAMMAAALQQIRGIPEWKTGSGSQPLLSRPAAFRVRAWKVLYVCPVHGFQSPVFRTNTQPVCPVCNQTMVVNQ